MNKYHIKDLAIINPSIVKGKHSPDTKVSFVPMAGVSDTTYSIEHEQIGDFSKYSKGYTYFEKGDLLLAKITPCFENGKVAIANISNDIGFGSTEFYVIRTSQDKLLPKYLYYILRSKQFLDLGKRNMTGSAGQKRLRRDFLESFQINVPSIEIQNKTILLLNKSDNFCEKRKQSITMLDEYLRSTFLEMFGDPVSNPKNWQKKYLKEFGEIVTGNTPPRNDPKNYSDKYIEWIKTDNILQDSMYISKATEYLSELGIKKGRSVKSGSLLVACIAGSFESIGRSALTDRTVSFNQQINAIQPYGTVNSVYLYWLFKLTRKYIQEHATKGMKKILTKGAFQQIEMVLPPIAIQNQFAVIAEKQEHIKQKMLVQLTQLDNQFQALMQKAFSPN